MGKKHLSREEQEIAIYKAEFAESYKKVAEYVATQSKALQDALPKWHKDVMGKTKTEWLDVDNEYSTPKAAYYQFVQSLAAENENWETTYSLDFNTFEENFDSFVATPVVVAGAGIATIRDSSDFIPALHNEFEDAPKVNKSQNINKLEGNRQMVLPKQGHYPEVKPQNGMLVSYAQNQTGALQLGFYVDPWKVEEAIITDAGITVGNIVPITSTTLFILDIRTDVDVVIKDYVSRNLHQDLYYQPTITIVMNLPKDDTPKTKNPSSKKAPRVEAPKVEAPKVEAPKVEAPEVEAPKVEAPKVEAPKVKRVRKPRKARKITAQVVAQLKETKKYYYVIVETNNGIQRIVRQDKATLDKATLESGLIEVSPSFARLTKTLTLKTAMRLNLGREVSKKELDAKKASLEAAGIMERVEKKIGKRVCNVLVFKQPYGSNFRISRDQLENLKIGE